MVKNIFLCLFVILLLGGCGLKDEGASQPTLKVIEENKQIELDELKQQREVETKTNNTEEIANEQEKDKEDVKIQTELNQEKKEEDAKKVVVKSNDSGEQQAEKSLDTVEQKDPEEEKVSTPEVNDQKVEDVISDKEKPNTETDTSTDKPVSNKKITWDGFFDNGDQTQPSKNFWDLKGSEVVIDGFMGEVLNIGQGWFLLIPAPGAECPFDNGDATYWNKIMIVFVKDKANLRFTGEPLRITGRLDVGVKVDESNYKTMFRLYDATIEKR